ncbi:MAG: pilus assembly protein [Caulobacter sp.]|nr:pilus assembly protein [Caulobacter sp.]
MALVSRSDRRPSRVGRLARRFLRDRDGATAVEFAFVSIPFLLLVYGIIELGMVFLLSMSLENAVATAGRQVRTGQAQIQAMDKAGFAKAVCDQMSWLGGTCKDTIRLDVRVVPSFASTNALPPPPNTTCWRPGLPGAVVMVRAYYAWPVITPFMAEALNYHDGQREVTAATVFANEPFNAPTGYVDTPCAN